MLEPTSSETTISLTSNGDSGDTLFTVDDSILVVTAMTMRPNGYSTAAHVRLIGPPLKDPFRLRIKQDYTPVAILSGLKDALIVGKNRGLKIQLFEESGTAHDVEIDCSAFRIVT